MIDFPILNSLTFEDALLATQAPAYSVNSYRRDTAEYLGMKSVRLDKTMETQLEEAARISREPVSNVIRQAIEQRCAGILGQRLSNRLADVTGIIRSRGGRARDTGKVFTKDLRFQRPIAQ